MKPKCEYDKVADVLYITLSRCSRVERTVEVADGVLLDFKKDGTLAGIEVIYPNVKDIG